MLFQAFSQVDSSASRKYGGTGLGLAISSKLIKLMNGETWVESEVNHGSTFHFTAWFELSNNQFPENFTSELTSLEGIPALIVDDNSTNRCILRNHLSRWGMIPKEVSGGKAALAELHRAYVAGEPYSLVLLDYMMPEMDGLTLAEKLQEHPELAGSTLMMLSSGDRTKIAKRCREVGVNAYMSKPIKRTELMQSILDTLGSSFTKKQNSNKSATFPKSDLNRLHVLLAEDNTVNQILGVKLLEKRGHSVVVATNGMEALEALRNHLFDLVLMDVQMPLMDGFEATKAIRTLEKETVNHIPIVAMTAHAMKGDRERCLAAGMDSYISKPLQPKILFETIEKMIPQNVTQSHQAEEPQLDNSSQKKEKVQCAFDVEEALLIVENDADLLKKIIEAFLTEYCIWMTQIKNAITSKDPVALRNTAHTLKGAARSLGACTTSSTALELETLGQQENFEEAEMVYAELEDIISQLVKEIKGYIQTENS